LVNVPGAGSLADQGTVVWSVNDQGTVAGQYFDSTGASHGFIRSPDGTFAIFGPNISILPLNINDPGVVTGIIDSRGTIHTPAVSYGFERLLDGGIVRFDGGGLGSDVSPAGINNKRVIVGSLTSAVDGHLRGFLRTADKTMTLISVPSSYNTNPTCLNNNGVVAGGYATLKGKTSREHGFVRAFDGTFVTFDPLGSVGTMPASVNSAGWITGQYADRAGNYHGFMRTINGTFAKFDPPGSMATSPQSINAKAIIAGYYVDSANIKHGFVRNPG
jgi:uncharacterized membrane protein